MQPKIKKNKKPGIVSPPLTVSPHHSALRKILTTGKLVLTLTTDACEGKENFIHYLEHIQAVVTVNVTRRGDLNINMMSPVGTKSILLSQCP